VIARTGIAITALAITGFAVTACAAANADDPTFDLRVADQTAELGTATLVSVAIVPIGGRVVSVDAPVRLAISADDGGLGLPRRRYQRKDAADPAADAPRFDVRVKATTPGDHRLVVAARFWLCQRKICRPVAIERTVTIHVPTPPIDAGIDAPTDAGVDATIDAGRRRR
jgi:hypothetical protein